MISYPNVKVNLGLSILRKRPDSYHDIETLFLPCDSFHDTLEIIAGDDYSRTSASLFERYDPSGRDLVSVPAGGAEAPRIVQAIREDGKLMVTIARAEGVDWNPLKDLTVKAYSLLDKDFGLPPVKIFLDKTSPVGAGLGGGSADAAFALRMLSDLFGLGLDDGSLVSYAARLGSDCPFFVYNRPMIGSGRGEILRPFDLDLSDFELRVVVPDGITVSTAEAYRGVVPRFPSAPSQDDNAFIALSEALSLPVSEWRNVLVNDFEASVFASHPELPAIKDSLYRQGAVYASMSGSGSAFFGLFKKPAR